ncbi:MAG: 30S ribosome-binding factor RbfA [Patescibacteria group bacterium]
MKFHREKFASALHEAASKYLAGKQYGNSMITVTSVDVSDDLSKANIKVTIYPESESSSVLKKLNRGKGIFAEYMKKNTRLSSIPLISFSIDEGEKYRQRIDDLTKEI